nr:hypothetical protein [Extibacter sp. GGCC_0201]
MAEESGMKIEFCCVPVEESHFPNNHLAL